MYAERLADIPEGINTDTIQAKIAASLLNNQPFETVFNIDKKKVHIEKITIEEEKLRLRLVPAS